MRLIKFIIKLIRHNYQLLSNKGIEFTIYGYDNDSQEESPFAHINNGEMTLTKDDQKKVLDAIGDKHQHHENYANTRRMTICANCSWYIKFPQDRKDCAIDGGKGWNHTCKSWEHKTGGFIGGTVDITSIKDVDL